MDLIEVIVQGTLRADGSVELDQRPSLAPGRVSVALRPIPSSAASEPFFELLKGIWKARAEAGLAPRSVAAVEADRQRLRDESAEEVAGAMHRQQDRPIARNSGNA